MKMKRKVYLMNKKYVINFEELKIKDGVKVVPFEKCKREKLHDENYVRLVYCGDKLINIVKQNGGGADVERIF